MQLHGELMRIKRQLLLVYEWSIGFSLFPFQVLIGIWIKYRFGRKSKYIFDYPFMILFFLLFNFNNRRQNYALPVFQHCLNATLFFPFLFFFTILRRRTSNMDPKKMQHGKRNIELSFLLLYFLFSYQPNPFNPHPRVHVSYHVLCYPFPICAGHAISLLFKLFDHGFWMFSFDELLLRLIVENNFNDHVFLSEIKTGLFVWTSKCCTNQIEIGKWSSFMFLIGCCGFMFRVFCLLLSWMAPFFISGRCFLFPFTIWASWWKPNQSFKLRTP